MARRSKTDKAIGFLTVAALLLGAVLAGVAKFFEAVGFVAPTAVAVGVLWLYLWRRHSVARATSVAQEVRRADIEGQILAAARRHDEQERIAEAHRARALENRRTDLLAKYGDIAIVDRLLARQVWLGQTSDQLRDSFGVPEDTDQKVMKTKTKEVWKYGHKGGNRYAYRITLEGGLVVGWDEKA